MTSSESIPRSFMEPTSIYSSHFYASDFSRQYCEEQPVLFQYLLLNLRITRRSEHKNIMQNYLNPVN